MGREYGVRNDETTDPADLIGEGAMQTTCSYCDAATSRLYDLPETTVRPNLSKRVACYFCFLRLTGLRPKRRQLIS
jgi:hypothetical protein